VVGSGVGVLFFLSGDRLLDLEEDRDREEDLEERERDREREEDRERDFERERDLERALPSLSLLSVSFASFGASLSFFGDGE